LKREFAAFSRKPARRASVRNSAYSPFGGFASFLVLGFASAAIFRDIIRRFFTGIV